MAQRRSLSWTELRVGLLVITSFALLALAIFYVSGNTSFFTSKYRITVFFHNANNLTSGAEPSLDGVTMGNGDKVAGSKDPDPMKAVEAVLSLDATYRKLIRTDSKITISTIGLLGDSKVDITRGSDAGMEIPDGGMIQGAEEGDIRKIVQGTNDFVANLQVLSEDFKKITDRIDRGEGTLGKFLTDTSIYDNANKAALELNQLVKDIRTGPGTVGRLINDDTLYRKLTEIEDHVDVLVMKIERGDGSAAKFINDPTLYNSVNDLTAKFKAITDRLDRGEGTFGKLLTDDKLYEDFRAGLTKVNGLIDTIQNGEGTAGKFIMDPTMYNSFTQTSSEIQKLLYDFRQNPKKFLTINFKLF